MNTARTLVARTSSTARCHAKFTQLIALVGILLLAFAVRVFDVERMPPFVHWDEVNQAQQPLTILSGEVPLLGVGYNGNPNLTFFQSAPYLLFGNNLWALRITSALWSVLAIAVAYFGVTQMFGVRVAILATLLMASAHVLIHFGRAGMNVLGAIPSSFLAVGLFLKAQRHQRAWLFGLAGAALALNLYEYVAARAVLFGVGALWLMSLPRSRRDWPRVARNTLWLAAGFSVAAAPVVWWYVENPQDLMSRAQILSVFGEWGARVNQSLYGTVDTPTLLMFQTLRSFGGFVMVSDTSPNYRIAAPLLDVGTTMLCMSGLIVAWRRQPKLTVALLVMMAAGLLAGAILLIEPPTSPHYIVLIPFAIVFAAVCLDWMVKPVGWIWLGMILIGICLLNLYLYFVYYPEHGAWYSLETDVGLFVLDTRGCCTVWYIGHPEETPRQISAFVAAPTPIRYLPDVDQVRSELNPTQSRPAIVIVPEETAVDVLSRLREWFPNGVEQSYLDRGRVMFRSYTMSAAR
ncbi:MAG: glycosyltransferase family 39 protein [Chloroflexota bacterium]